MDFRKNDIINEVLDRYYDTFSRTLDTMDFVPTKYNEKIYKFIFKNMKKSFAEVKKEYKSLLSKDIMTKKIQDWLVKQYGKLFCFSRSKNEDLQKIDKNNIIESLESLEEDSQKEYEENNIDCET